MSESFEIKSSTGDYRVTLVGGVFSHVVRKASNRLYIADTYFMPRFEEAGIAAIGIESSEATKSLDAMPTIISEMRKRGANRQTELIAAGGGIVQDVAAFAASIFMRGIAWSYVPTTVLAMADSCIGGKSSINVGPYKNLAGTFHPPAEIFIDPSLAATLSEEQRSAGLVEAAKICYCRGEREFAEYLRLRPRPVMHGKELEPVILAALRAKKWFIETDEFDRAERLLLNFGHTFGHAIEGASHFRIAHGIAVGVGILCALEFRKAGTGGKQDRVDALEAHMRELLSAAPSSTAELRKLQVADVMDRFQADKKHTATHYTIIVPQADGEIALTKHEKTDAVRKAIAEAVASTVAMLA